RRRRVVRLPLPENSPWHSGFAGYQRPADDVGVRRVLAADTDVLVDPGWRIVVHLRSGGELLECQRGAATQHQHHESDQRQSPANLLPLMGPAAQARADVNGTRLRPLAIRPLTG